MTDLTVVDSVGGARAACGGAGIGAGAACGGAGIGAGSSAGAASGSVGAPTSSASAAIGSINATPSSAGASSAASGSSVGDITPENLGSEFALKILDLFSRKQTKDNEKHKRKVFRIISRDIRWQLTKKNLPLFAQTITDILEHLHINLYQLHVFIIVNLSPLVKHEFTFPSLLKNKRKAKKANLLHDLL